MLVTFPPVRWATATACLQVVPLRVQLVGAETVTAGAIVYPEPPTIDSAPATGPDRPTGVVMPSTTWSFHWSKVVIFQLPGGIPEKLNVPSSWHLVKAISAPSGSPRLT